VPPIIGRSTEGRDVRINVERLIETRAIVMSRSGGGKSFTLRRLLEQTHGQVQQIVIDVEAEFFTLREKFDYVLAGGAEGDCPADTRSAAMLARKLLELRVSAIIDIYELKAHDRIRFVRLFLESLIESPKSLWHPCLVVIDEAQLFAPESTKCESTQAVIDLMTRGRKRGFAGVLATQRPASLSKDASAQAINKLIGGFSQDIDVERAAKDLGFFKRESRAELQTLSPGSFFAVGPALCENVTEIKVGPVVTTHPRAGQRAMAPPPPREAVKKVLASLADLPAEAAKELVTIEELRAEVRKLQAEARKATPAADMLALKAQHAEVVRRYQTAAKRAVEMLANVPQAIEATREFIAPIAGEDDAKPFLYGADAIALRSTVPTAKVFEGPRKAESNGHKRESADTPEGPRRLLIAIAQLRNGVSSEHLAVLTGYKLRTRQEYLRRLLASGFVTRDGKLFVATAEGLRDLGNNYKPLPTGDAARKHWMATLPIGERKLLEIAVENYPQSVSSETLKDSSGFALRSVQEYVRRLISRQLLLRAERGAVRASKE